MCIYIQLVPSLPTDATDEIPREFLERSANKQILVRWYTKHSRKQVFNEMSQQGQFEIN